MLASRNSWQTLILQVFTVNIELCWGSPNSQRGPRNHNENAWLGPGVPMFMGSRKFYDSGLLSVKIISISISSFPISYFLFLDFLFLVLVIPNYASTWCSLIQCTFLWLLQSYRLGAYLNLYNNIIIFICFLSRQLRRRFIIILH